MLIIAIAAGAFCVTFAGGLFALRLKDKLHLVLGFSAGAVIGVAFFDLLPEALELGEKYQGINALLGWAGLGFLLYLILDRVILFHGQAAHNGHEQQRVAMRGTLGAISLSTHSFLDGIAIGLAFQASVAVGAVVAIGVLTHDFSDGINTTNVILKNGGTRRQALRWLAGDSLAPVAGIASTALFTIPQNMFGIILSMFAGFFLYIGASDLIPESQHAHPKILTTVMTLAGAAVLYAAIMISRL